MLLQQQPLLYDYLNPMEMIEALAKGEVWLGHCYSGDAYFAAEDNPDITYVIPQEGCSVWMDNFAIPADAPHKYTAEVFLNYMLDAEVGAACANYTYYASANQAAEQYIDSEILSDPSIYPPDSVMERLEFWQEVTEAMSAHNSIWAELQRNK